MHANQVAAELAELNRKLNNRLLVCWGILIFEFLLIFLFENQIFRLAHFVSEHVPSVSRQLAKNTVNGDRSASYFSMIVLTSPILVVILSWRENFLNRALYVGKIKGRGRVRSILAICLFSGPVGAGALYLLYALPLMSERPPELWGERIGALMTNTLPGLFVFGSTLGVGVVIFGVCVYAAIQVPILLFLNMFCSRR